MAIFVPYRQCARARRRPRWARSPDAGERTGHRLIVGLKSQPAGDFDSLGVHPATLQSGWQDCYASAKVDDIDTDGASLYGHRHTKRQRERPYMCPKPTVTLGQQVAVANRDKSALEMKA